VGPAPVGNPLTQQELYYYQQNTGVQLDEFEVTTLVSMSRTYLAMLHDARKNDCPWPCKRPLTDAEKIAQSKRMRKRIKKESE
jgi:hypothetical protein